MYDFHCFNLASCCNRYPFSFFFAVSSSYYLSHYNFYFVFPWIAEFVELLPCTKMFPRIVPISFGIWRGCRQAQCSRGCFFLRTAKDCVLQSPNQQANLLFFFNILYYYYYFLSMCEPGGKNPNNVETTSQAHKPKSFIRLVIWLR